MYSLSVFLQALGKLREYLIIFFAGNLKVLFLLIPCIFRARDWISPSKIFDSIITVVCGKRYEKSWSIHDQNIMYKGGNTWKWLLSPSIFSHWPLTN